MELKVGMYVRTTYGIGKITNMNIIYTNDGSFWHISCLTDYYVQDRGYIEIGLYAKKETYGKKGNFLRVYKEDEEYSLFENYYTSLNKEIIDNYLEERGTNYVCYINYGNTKTPRGNSGLYDDHKFIKSSFNLIDLIEVGDYVNGWLVTEKSNDELILTDYSGLNDDKLHKIKNYDIKSIVTREQFKSTEYRIGDTNE